MISLKIATRNTIAAALAVALASMGMPVAALAANSAESVSGSAMETRAADGNVTVIDGAHYTDFLFGKTELNDVLGKWYALDAETAADCGADPTVLYMVDLDEKGNVAFHLGGSGKVGNLFLSADCVGKYYRQRDQRSEDTYLYVGKGITAFRDSTGGYLTLADNIVFEQGSELREIGVNVFSGRVSINLEACQKLEKIGRDSLSYIKTTVTIPASVTEIGDIALKETEFIAEDPKKAPITVEVTDDPNTAISGTVTVVPKPKAKVASPNKVAVSWSAPVVRTFKNGTASDTAINYAVKYKVQYRESGDPDWYSTGYVSGKSKTLTMLNKGSQYEVRVAAYKKGSSGKWTAVTTSQKATSSAVKGYDPVPKLKAGKKSLTASWSKVKGATSYKVYYKKSTSKKWSTKKVGKSAKVKLSKLSSKKTYQVRVVAYKGKTGICQSSTFKSVKVK